MSQEQDMKALSTMRVQAPLSNSANFVVIDTNLLLHHLKVLQQFVEDIENLSLPTIIVVPGIVIHELDR
jgi:rRNA-processing protein FCF1